MTAGIAIVALAGLVLAGAAWAQDRDGRSISFAQSECDLGCVDFSMTIYPDDTYALDAGPNARTPGHSEGALPENTFYVASELLGAAEFLTLPPTALTHAGSGLCEQFLESTQIYEVTEVWPLPDGLSPEITRVRMSRGCIGRDVSDRAAHLTSAMMALMGYSRLVAPEPFR